MTHPLIAARLAMPVTHYVVTHYVDGTTKRHGTQSIKQAENFASGESRKIGKKLINRETGKTVMITHITIVTA